MNYEYVAVSTLKPEGDLRGKVGFTSILTPILTLLVGLWFIVTRTTLGYVFGAILVVISVAFMIFVRDHTTVELYDHEVLLYQDGNPNQAVLLPFDAIKEFDFSRNENGKLVFDLVNGQQFSVTTFCKIKTARVLDGPLKGKAHNDVLLSRLKTRKKKEAQ